MYGGGGGGGGGQGVIKKILVGWGRLLSKSFN